MQDLKLKSKVSLTIEGKEIVLRATPVKTATPAMAAISITETPVPSRTPQRTSWVCAAVRCATTTQV